MAPIKFEENIKDKLEKRTLSPSSESWSQLSERLDADEKKSKKPIFWWLSIAAGLLIMLAISVQFFNNNESQEILPQIVEEEITEDQLNSKNSESDFKEPIELATEENSKKETESILPMGKTSTIRDYKKVTNKNPEQNTQLAETDKTSIKATSKTIEKEENNALQADTEDTIIENALAEAMKTLKSENNTVTDQEIDSLLKIASKELFREKLQNETTKTVDATQLLESVEDEMGQSFRTKVFEALKESYETVKTAVADRNN